MSKKKPTKLSNFPLELSKGMSDEDRKDFELAWRNSTYVTDVIKEQLETRLESLLLDNEDDYANPNWQYVRADRNGRIKEIKQLIRYLP
jgi:hypothetical protein